MRQTAAVIGHFEIQVAFVDLKLNAAAFRPCMADRVGQRFLNNPVYGGFHGRGQRGYGGIVAFEKPKTELKSQLAM
ncbi:hypothetical protein [Cohnella sp. CFH 77786]|uniref:hypothetical protein n=1 Tax=Cohnella sp. CFH 77786 TaxID=2662265 RepID=UPI002103CCD3|nr:hypothetical protein [Cohnella sp. CFH 77786]